VKKKRIYRQGQQKKGMLLRACRNGGEYGKIAERDRWMKEIASILIDEHYFRRKIWFQVQM
jgi:hypothetical protein